MESATRPLDALLDLLLPTRCAGCGAARSQLCSGCRTALARATGHPVRPDPPPPGLPPVFAAAEYAGPVRALLLAHKERGALRLAAPLGAALATAVRAAAGLPAPAGGPLLLVPVPSTRRAVRARGHDPVQRLARAALRQLRREGLHGRTAPLLRPVRAVADQSGLTAPERWRNLTGALAVRPSAAPLLHRRPVVLVDDLVTTGASLAEAARALAAAGAEVVAAATVAATARRDRGRRAGGPGARTGPTP
ncbi:ComF family protein [Streptacidiphilus griseoplanus]|uniref:ComF family protein n=1 Tax=Peterkaempfera griseoplana TaxID=66896 RepID=UPI000B00ED78|nr:phosphoribosyltransferase family protein [Peterkaempfera griseoplana]